MLISMTPNEEVKTIHASLNDGSLRKWEFEPYTENGKIELTDQDYATIQSIKGNTVKFNQLVESRFPTYSDGNITITNNGDGSFTLNGTTIGEAAFRIDQNSNGRGNPKNYKKGIYYLYMTGYNNITFHVMDFDVYNQMINSNHNGLFTVNEDWNNCFIYISMPGGTTFNNQKFTACLINLTSIFGSGNEPSTVSDFDTWLSNNIGLLPYYDYTQGSLISFNGTGLKTVGKNLINANANASASGVSWSIVNNKIIVTGTPTGFTAIDLEPIAKTEFLDSNYTLSIDGEASGFVLGIKEYQGNELKTTNEKTLIFNPYDYEVSQFAFFIKRREKNVPVSINGYLQLELGSTATEYEPYTESILSLPISTYFPTGMKEAGSVYDELTESKAITRVGSRAYQSGDESDTSVITDGTTTYYALATPTSQDISIDLTYPIWDNGTEQIIPVNESTPATSPMLATIEYPDRTEDVNFLYKQTTFESAIPQFSLVCKNQELPMTSENGKLICECDSSITNESGFFDAKVKMQDLESVAYSQKIQLHVERGIND